MGSKFWMLKQTEKAIGKAIGFHGGDTQPEIAGNLQNLFNQFFKINVPRLCSDLYLHR